MKSWAVLFLILLASPASADVVSWIDSLAIDPGVITHSRASPTTKASGPRIPPSGSPPHFENASTTMSLGECGRSQTANSNPMCG